MREIGDCSTLTVYHDGQFWVGMYERVENGKLSVCRIVFGAEPSNEEILELICHKWNRLHFTDSVECDEDRSSLASNPKRRQREAAREQQRRGPSTKAQQALAEEREAMARERRANAREGREQERQRRFEQRQEKRKRKHRGK